MPLTNPNVDKCMECGFCEVNCLSSGFSLSSRQRIVAQREISRLKTTGEDPKRLARLEKLYRYYGNSTCAADGLCSTSCPMKINTGDMTHDLRAQSLPEGSMGYKTGRYCARHLNGVRKGLKGLLYMADAAHFVLRDGGVAFTGKALHKVGVPLWTPSLPKAHMAKTMAMPETDKKVVYFPSCLNQTMGHGHKGEKTDLADKVVAFLKKAGWQVIFPQNMKKMCCGMIWESKGMPDLAKQKALELEEAMWQASNEGAYPVVCDQSPCLHHMRKHFTCFKPLELMEFVHDYVAQDLDFHATDEPIALHLTCSTKLMGINGKVLDLAKRCSSQVLVPDGVGCCGFAGDKGFTHPELNAYALRKLRPQIENAGIKRGFSNSRTCEIGLTTNSGIPYQSLIYLIDECTTTKNDI